MFVLEEFFRKYPKGVSFNEPFWVGHNSETFTTTGKVFHKYQYYRRYGSNCGIAYFKRMYIIGGEEYVSTIQNLQL